MKLLKVAFCAAIFLIISLSAKAEIVSFNFSAGSTSTYYNIDGYSTWDNRGYNISAGLTFGLPIISISPEVVYTNNSFYVDNPYIFGDYCDIRDHRLDIPVVVGLNFLGPLVLEAGPVFTVYNEAIASYYHYSSGNLGRIHPDMGYLLGAKVTLFDKVMFGARYNGQFGSRRIDYYGHDVRSHSYTFIIGFIL
ncbi:MAG: hypothetical protein R3Y39_00295 [Rikenellaceae bacterium]